MQNKSAAGSSWTIRTAAGSKQSRTVTSTTVKELSRDKSLCGVVRIAKKYAK